MTIEILGRLPIRCIMRCKCVCKSWRNLIEGGDFATSYTPKPGVAFAHREMGYALCDEAYHTLFKFDLPPPYRTHNRVIIGPANGLLLLRDGCANILFVCNPVTREYVELPPLHTPMRSCFFGFGVSRLSGQYKILCADQFRSYHVYTLGGEGLWRSIATPTTSNNILVPRINFGIHFEKNIRVCCLDNLCVPHDYAVFLNGNLHWLEYDSRNNLYVCCFDLETEVLTGFSIPNYGGRKHGNYRLCILEGRLCFCDTLETVIWRMNNCGDEKSWVRVYIFFSGAVVPALLYPLKVLANDDLLYTVDVHDELFIYRKNDEDPLPRFETNGLLQRPIYYYSNIAIYSPNFLSLKTIGVHNVQSLSFC